MKDKNWKRGLTGLRKLDQVELLALLGPCDMGRDERVHEGLGVGAPPLRKAVANFPVGGLVAFAQAADWCKALIEAALESLNLVIFGMEVVARQLEESIGNLEH